MAFGTSLRSLLASWLTELRHAVLSSGDCRVCTTFSIKLKMGGKTDSEVPQKGFLLAVGFGDAAETDLPAVSGRQHDVGALECRQQGQRLHRSKRLRIVDPASRRLRNNRRPPL